MLLFLQVKLFNLVFLKKGVLMLRLFFIFLATTFLFACNNSSIDSAADEATAANEAAPTEEKAFHSTDALLIGGNGGFNPSAEDGGADLELSPEIK